MLIEILNEWNLWKKEFNIGFIRRQYLFRLIEYLSANQVVIVTGPRRAGKSFIMKQAATELIKSGVQKNNILMVNFEDPRFQELNVDLLEKIHESYIEFLNPKGEIFIFLDEVQEIKGWEKWVRMMHELKKAKLIISGSNANLLSKELGTLLTGRHLDLTVFPLSFGEFLEFNKVIIRDKLDLINQKIEVQKRLRQYIEYGSFPEVVLSELKKEILFHYFEDVINKDVIQRFKIRKPIELKSLIKFYLSNSASLVTSNSLEKFLKISADTIEKFSSYFEQVYLVFMLKRFSFKVKEQEKSPRKNYSIDTGFSNVLGFRFSENLGKSVENIVFLSLKRQELENPLIELFYWKDELHREVDFLVKKGYLAETRKGKRLVYMPNIAKIKEILAK